MKIKKWAVVAPMDEDIEQISTWLDSLEDAERYLNTPFVQKRWEYAYIIGRYEH